MTPATDELLVDHTDGVATLTLNRPEARNALSISLRDALVAAVRWARAEDTVRCLLITGAGGSFCAGMDLAASSASKAGQPGFQAHSMSQALRVGVHALITELWELDKPVVAAVDGAAVGPGAHIALACDFALVQPATKFLWSFSNIGLVADAGGAWLLPRVVGLPRAKAMIMLSEGSVGEQAVTDGLAYRCVPADELLPAAQALAAKLASGPTRALGLSKQLLNHAYETPLATSLQIEAYAQALACTTSDLVEGLASFREKRPVEFKGV